MKFSEYKYERPNIEVLCQRLEELTIVVKEGTDIKAVKNAIDDMNKLSTEFSTSSNLAFIRNSINTTDEFYEAEINFLNEEGVKLSEKLNAFNKVLVNHPLRDELEAIYGDYWFKRIELSLKCFDPSIMEELVEESKLTIEYDKLMASAQIEYDGKVNNLSQMGKYTTSVDRRVRLKAYELINKFIDDNGEAIGNIYDKLVKLRHNMALKLGYKNFIELGYARMGRTDYDAKMVETYRKQVLESVVPVAFKIILENGKRIGIENPKFYDQSLEFLDGNPTPKGTKDELVNKALSMYTEMSPETKGFFEFMVEHELLDLESKPGKQNGGYCTYIDGYKSPFIFANFNGTSGDVDVLTHEAGHAFMAYCASESVNNPDLIWPTSEACEIHSMSMEFFAYPWIDSFFEADTTKYKISHMNGAITFIPYGVCVDHFQHLVYENPEATPAQRLEMWKNLEKLYTPWRDMEGLVAYDKGCFWYRQGHIFSSPFYYIDYTLAQVCALEYYLKSLEDRKASWDSYVKLCKLGGTKSFLGLISEVGINNPFIDGSIKKIIDGLLPVIEKLK